MKYLIGLLAFVSVVAFGRSANQAYVMPNSGNIPGWAQLDVSKSAAVKNQLSPANGGTGLSTSSSTGVPSISSGTWSVNTLLPTSLGGTGISTSPGTNRNVLMSTGSIWAPTAFTPPSITNLSDGAATTGTISTSSVCITSIGSTSGIIAGAFIEDVTNPTAITLGTTVVAVPGTCSAGQVQMSAVAATNETGDSLIFGGVFTVPTSPSPLYCNIFLTGGGGGGAGGGTAGNSGLAGGTSIFGSLSLMYASGGAGGIAGSSGTGGAGGSIFNGAGASLISGGYGNGGGSGAATATAAVLTAGGVGGGSPFGGGGGAGALGAVGGSSIGSGGGGAGGGCGTTASCYPGGGGAGGGSIEAQISSLSATYSYILGYAAINGGAPGGSGGFNGGLGSPGFVTAACYFQ